MKKYSTLLLLAFFSSLAFAHPYSPTHSENDTVATESPEVIVTPVGFDKVLSMILIDIETPSVAVEFSRKGLGKVFQTTLLTDEAGVLELDMNDFEAGTYTLKIVAGDYKEIQTIILP